MVLGVLRITGLLAVVLFIFISPVLGAVTAFLFDVLISHLFKNSHQNRMKRIFTPLQIVACLFQATSHGANDGMHAVGVITALLVSAGILATFVVPTWVILLSPSPSGLVPVLAAGRLWTGWQKASRRSGRTRGSVRQRLAARPLPLSRLQGIPVSSNHVISGAIVGVGVPGEKMRSSGRSYAR